MSEYSNRSKRIAEAVVARLRGVKESAEDLHEIGDTPAGKKALGSYVKKASTQVLGKGIGGGMALARNNADGEAEGHKLVNKAVKRMTGIQKAADKLTKEETDACMTDTSMGGADQIAQSKTGEVYKKSSKPTTGPSPATGTSTHISAGKTGEAYNSTPAVKRVPAVEAAVMEVMKKTFELRQIYLESSNLSIVTPEQRNDWMNVERGQMNVVDYFNKYKTEE